MHLIAAPLAASLFTGMLHDCGQLAPTFAATFVPIVLLARAVEAPLWAAIVASTLIYAAAAPLIGADLADCVGDVAFNVALAALAARILADTGALADAPRDVTADAERDLLRWDERWRDRQMSRKREGDDV